MIIAVFLNGYTMYISSISGAGSYGRLVSWDDADDAFMLMQKGLQFQPGTGLLLLEVQSQIYSFLLECCYQLFHDVPRDELASLQLLEQPEPPPIVASEISYAQLSSLAAEAPEDPGYFASVAVDLAQHRLKSLLDIRGQRHPHDDDEVFWNRVLRSVAVEAHMSFLSWDILYKYAVSLDKAFKSAGTLYPNRPLPEKLNTALVKLCFAAEMVSKGLVAELKTAVPTSPPIRERFVREPQKPGTTIMRAMTKQSAGSDPLLQLFAMLWDADKVFLAQLPNLVDELQRCVDRDPGQKGRMSSYVAGYLSNLSLIVQIIGQVKTFFPWAAGLDMDMSPEKRGPSFAKASEDANSVTNVNACRQAEAQLDRLWEVVDAHFEKHTDKTLHEIFLSHDVKAREIHRTPEWTPPPRVSQPNNKGKENEALSDSFSRLKVEPDKPSSFKGPEVFRAPKIKTRGPYPLPDSSNATRALPDDPTPPFPVFTLPRRVHKVFAFLFPTSSNPSPGGEIAWTDSCAQ
ncbi:hypothetical protein AYO21_06336 [Fonsecaea monophora]|uniref:Uncharacterized protein n=1 Tax=Fonsecaea monophora TaxID=254056 RepID=A0A177F5K2_9EURO|nr:hypothetical protein AYO21_06336 [Fonsecaea monophora]OAG39508.1 hypothetical protein AYO21_06336 [Fonsecaea monophora]